MKLDDYLVEPSKVQAPSEKRQYAKHHHRGPIRDSMERELKTVPKIGQIMFYPSRGLVNLETGMQEPPGVYALPRPSMARSGLDARGRREIPKQRYVTIDYLQRLAKNLGKPLEYEEVMLWRS